MITPSWSSGVTAVGVEAGRQHEDVGHLRAEEERDRHQDERRRHQARLAPARRPRSRRRGGFHGWLSSNEICTGHGTERGAAP
ncbi:MAG: hypothetical protein HS111_03550 [Kofleriaceae bacterium]|nr:hypothetical protein [Kofleriaceae bacterium]